MDGAQRKPSMRWIPVELLHEILRHLDKSSLIPCAQVSRDWMHLSRIYLFSCITYRIRPESYRKGLDQNGARYPLQDLAAYLHDSPTVCEYIQHLTLTLTRQRPQRPFSFTQLVQALGEDQHTDLEFCRFQTLVDVLSRLPNLTTLKVDGIPFHRPEPPFDTQPVHGSPVVRHLAELSIPRWWQAGAPAHPETMLHLLSLFEEVDRLDLGPYRLLPQLAPPTLGEKVNTRLHSLAFQEASDLAAIMRLPQLGGLRTLSIPWLRPVDVAFVSSLTNLARDNLRDISLQVHQATEIFKSPAHDLSYLDTLDLAACTQLETLAISVSVYDVPQPSSLELVDSFRSAGFYEPAYAYLTRMLDSLSPTLASISFTLHYFSADPLYGHYWDHHALRSFTSAPDSPVQADWSALDSILADRVSRGLQTVEFKDLRRPCLSVTARKHLIEALPMTWRCGVVRFSQGPRF